MLKAKLEEFRGLLDGRIDKTVMTELIPPDFKALTGLFVLYIKYTEDGSTRLKVHFVAGGHSDKTKNLMVHSSQTIQKI